MRVAALMSDKGERAWNYNVCGTSRLHPSLHDCHSKKSHSIRSGSIQRASPDGQDFPLRTAVADQRELTNVGQEFWRIMKRSGALGGGMDTRFRRSKLNGLRSGDQPVAWPVAVIEERNQLAREIRETLVRDFAGIQLQLFT